MKKILVIIFTLSLLITPITKVDASFKDVSSSHSNFDAINYVQSERMVSGYNDGTFKPDQTINRAEFTKIIIGSKYSTTEINTCTPNQTFSDIDPFEVPWIYQYTCMARNAGIINGYSDNTFKPYQNISFIEASKIIANTFDYDITENNEAWYKPFVEKLAEKKAIPTSIDSFQKNITRGEMAEMVYRLKANVTSKESKGYEELESGGWQTYSNEDLGVSFQYPNSYKLIKDSVKVTYSTGQEWREIVIENSSIPEKPTMLFEINADGYGPIFSDKSYKIKLVDGKINIIDETISEVSEYSNNETSIIGSSGIIDPNGNNYHWRFWHMEEGLKYENDFKKILSSFEFKYPDDWNTYHSDYGFTLTFPDSWKGFMPSKRIINWNYGLGDSIDFGFEEQESLFNLNIHSRESWDKLQEEEGPKPTYLSGDDYRVYAYSIAQDAINDDIAEKIKVINTILDTFKFN